MKGKIIPILVMTLLIATVVSVTGEINEKSSSIDKNDVEISIRGEVLDQYQENCGECEYFEVSVWQQFVPTISKLLRVEVCVAQWYISPYDLTLSIEKPLGNVLTSKSLPATSIPESYCDWVSFDVPDIMLTIGDIYYIVLSCSPYETEYGWCGIGGNPYTKGESDKHPDWDWCFRTFADQVSGPSIDIEKYVKDPNAGGAWTDADTVDEAVDIPICNDAKFKIVVHNNGDSSIININISDQMHDSLNYIFANPEPKKVWYDSAKSEWRMYWLFEGPLNPCETIEIYIEAEVEGPECSVDYNRAFVNGITLNGEKVQDIDYAYVHAYKKSKELKISFSEFLQAPPNILLILKLLLHSFGLQ
jgi:hypothetical protein